MSSILIKNVQCDGAVTDVFIRNDRFLKIAPGIDCPAEDVIDGSGMAILPPFYNTHTHAAMALLRGFADDMELFEWLSKHIWPAEALLTPDDIYAGSRLAILEMLKSGSVFFNDMYWHPLATARAVEEMGVRGCLGLLYLSGSDQEVLERNARSNQQLLEASCGFSSRLAVAHAPHAVYTVSEPSLRRVATEQGKDGRIVHIHVSETSREVEECLKEHGVTPIVYLDRLGLVGRNSVLVHAVHATDEEFELIRRRGAVLSHCPCSNAKLSSGLFSYRRARGCRITLGTDGCSSNNTMSMFATVKCAALTAKAESMDPTVASADEIWSAATRAGAEAFGIDAGVIAEGKLADAMLVDLDNPMLTPCFHLRSNLVYAADSGCVDTVICNGKVLIRHRRVDGEKEIVEQARKTAEKLRNL